MTTFTITQLVVVATALRVGFFLFGVYQDAYMTVKYTDIDYLVFSDAANYVVEGASPYARETYRYTPLLAWMMIVNHWFYSWGKWVFMVCDLVTGVLIYASTNSVVNSAIWLLNPMVITISTRGSAESVVTVLVMLFVWGLSRRTLFSAAWLGLAIHFKIYPVIYLPTAIMVVSNSSKPHRWFNFKAISYAVVAVATVLGLAAVMYRIYGYEFLYETYMYHFHRWDHRHNFSVYNVLLYYKSATSDTGGVLVESVAFIPQLAISAVLIPLLFWQNLHACLFMQTFAFVTFNKVMTSQYFIWFLIFLPGYIRELNITWRKGLVLVGIWVVTQGLWLSQAYNLEFLGIPTFDTGLVYSSIGFFLGNCWILCELMRGTEVNR